MDSWLEDWVEHQSARYHAAEIAASSRRLGLHWLLSCRVWKGRQCFFATSSAVGWLVQRRCALRIGTVED